VNKNAADRRRHGRDQGALTEAGLLAFVVENRIHVVPPCTITAEQVAQGLAIFDAVFARFASLAK
jgi:taurine--2-oxoglutarate transaminase